MSNSSNGEGLGSGRPGFFMQMTGNRCIPCRIGVAEPHIHDGVCSMFVRCLLQRTIDSQDEKEESPAAYLQGYVYSSPPRTVEELFSWEGS